MTLGGETESDSWQKSHEQKPATPSNPEATPYKTADTVGSTKSETEAQPVAEAPQPPNGGTETWLRVLAGFFVFFNTW